MEPERTQIAHVQAVRARRDDARAREGLEEVRRACAGDANVMDAVLEAARRDATLGEICRVFRDVFGEYRDPAEL
jgi:methylmalonyl-CoA mutase N-terminal domain/subunit